MHDLVPIILFISLFGMIFGVAYLRSRENMAMLEKGLNPRNGDNRLSIQPFISLKIGLLLTGAGLGLFLAYLLERQVFSDGHNYVYTEPLYPAMIGIGGGIGLVISYFIEKKHMDKQ